MVVPSVSMTCIYVVLKDENFYNNGNIDNLILSKY